MYNVQYRGISDLHSPALEICYKNFENGFRNIAEIIEVKVGTCHLDIDICCDFAITKSQKIIFVVGGF